jgi:hypothetical protein
MALIKEKTLSSGVTGNYWRIKNGRFKRDGALIFLDLELALFKDSTAGLDPLGCSHLFSFELTNNELIGNLISLAYTKIKDFSNSDIPNLNGVGTHKGCEDLVGAIDG